MRDWLDEPWFWVAGAAGLLVLGVTEGKQMSFAVKDITTRGKKASQGLRIDRLGIIATLPETLRQQASEAVGASITNDLYAAARMIRSEGAAQGEIRLHVAFNDLATFPYAKNLYELLTYSTDPKRRGVYGDQWSPAVPPDYPKQNARRYSTNKDPYVGDIGVAERVFRDRAAGIDKARGATKFIDKSSMGVQPGTVTFAQKNAEWVAGGYEPFQLPEYGTDLVLYRPRKATV